MYVKIIFMFGGRYVKVAIITTFRQSEKTKSVLVNRRDVKSYRLGIEREMVLMEAVVSLQPRTQTEP